MHYFLEKEDNCRAVSWQTITRKTVDSITFYCIPNIESAPRIEDCSYETTGIARSQPRIPLDLDSIPCFSQSGKSGKKKNGSRPSVPSTSSRRSSSASGKKLQCTDHAPWESSTSSSSHHDKSEKRVSSSSNHSSSSSGKPKYRRSASEGSSKASTKSSSSRRSSATADLASKSSPSSASTEKRKSTSNSSSNTTKSIPTSPPPARSTGATRSSFSESRAKFEAALKKSENSPQRVMRSGGEPKPTLGSFLKTMAVESAKAQPPMTHDDHSIGSRSLASLSIADRSNAEMSKSEKELFNKSKHHKVKRKNRTGSSHRRGSKDFGNDDSTSDNDIPGMAALNKYFNASTIAEGDEDLLDEAVEIEVSDSHSVMSGSTLGSKSITQLSIAERSTNEARLKNKNKSALKGGGRAGGQLSAFLEVSERSLDVNDIGPVVKKLRFQDGHEIREIPYPTASMYDDLFWDEDELAEFRYEAFMEEAGLDINDFR